jgi:hypothetical protein
MALSLLRNNASTRPGNPGVFEVLELQKRLAEAETSEIRAKADYNKAVARYRQQTGMTLKVHNVHTD